MNTLSMSFKGYDAAPLKNIYLTTKTSIPFDREMHSICQNENINLRYIADCDRWTQDRKCIVQKDSGLIMLRDVEDIFYEGVLESDMETKYNMPVHYLNNFLLQGGNTFIGKFPNGEKWLITGESISPRAKGKIGEAYGIKPENIHQVAQPDFHLDMAIRPIGFPNILVNDPKLVRANIKKLDDGSEEFEIFMEKFILHDVAKRAKYCDVEKVCKSLKKLGFNPIRVAGVYGNGVNFMNAIVNKHSDGSLSYITNSSECKNHIVSKLQKMFEDELKEKAPEISNIYFVQGKDAKKVPIPSVNYMMDSLENCFGGLHCMSLEEPDFEKWV